MQCKKTSSNLGIVSSLDRGEHIHAREAERSLPQLRVERVKHFKAARRTIEVCVEEGERVGGDQRGRGLNTTDSGFQVGVQFVRNE
jgi:hypothetical protein